MPMTKNDIKMLLYQLVDELAPTYGIKDRERFVDALASIISYEDPSWDPSAAGDNGHSIGLFQLHDAGQGTGMSVAQRSDPETNIRKAISYLGPIWASSETQGLDFDQSLQRMISEGQRPADPDLAFQRAKAASADVTAGTALQPGVSTVQNQSSNQDFIAWLKSHGFGSYVQTNENGNEFAGDAGWNPPPSWLGQAYLEDTMGTTSGLTPEESALTKAQTGRTLAETAQINQEIGGYAANVSLDEREQKRREEETRIKAGDSTWQEAVARFNAWLDATTEARTRAEKEFDVAEKRAAFTRPTATYTRPAHKQVMEQYGLTYTPEQGIPTEQLPNLENTYAKWSQNLGVSQNAPAMAGVSTGPTPSQQFIQHLIAKAQTRQTGLVGMAGGGQVAPNKPFIAGEMGKELVQPTPTGTVVTPLRQEGYRPNYQRLLALFERRQGSPYSRWAAMRGAA